MDIEQPQFQQENERIFTDFLNRQPVKDPSNFSFDLDAFRALNPATTRDVIKNPTKYFRIIRNFLIKNLHGDQKKKFQAKIDHFTISFEGNLGSNFVSPRGLNSRMSNQLVGIQGIVTKMDLVRCQLEKSVHWCEKTKGFEVKEYPDSYAPEKQFEANKTRFIRTHDDHNNPLEFEYGLSSFRDIQHLVVQELPEMAPPGLLPQSVSVVIQGDLVNTIKPGDRVEMMGIYKLIAGIQSKERGIFRPYFICLSVKPLVMTISQNKLTARMPCSQSELFPLFSRSIAPSIYGHEHLKKAVLLMLLGGCEKVLENSTHLRGDINLLMVGDPGTAKSQILRWILTTVDLGIGTTGSGASGVGLTAAIVADRETGEKALEAGAMVLADRGVVCIDQFDKMNEVDRVAVHEVMEQQTVTIAKAGIHCSLNARCSVVAAANPIYGEYQSDRPPTKNIGMPDSLLSRFDLIFIVLDEKSAERDKKVAERVCRNHMLAPMSNQWSTHFREDDDYIIQPSEVQKVSDETTFEKSNVFRSDSKAEILSQSFLKKYINYCKANINPILTDDSITVLASMWTVLRQQDLKDRESQHTKVLPITIRSYETLIRLSTAHAKLRHSSIVDLIDCVEAFRLMIFCLFGSEDALDEEMRQIFKENNLEMVDLRSHSDERITRGKPSKKDLQKKEEQEEVIKRIEKIEINKDEKEIDKILNKASKIPPSKEKISETYRQIIGLNKKKREEFILFDALFDIVKTKKITKDELKVILGDLDLQGKIHYNDQKIYI